MENGILSLIKTQDTTLQGKPSVSNIEAAIQTDDYELVRSFPKKSFKKENINFVLGSTILTKLENDQCIEAWNKIKSKF